MSTRILAGFRLPASTDVLAFTEQVRPVLARVRAELMAQWLSAAISDAVDGRALGGDLPDGPVTAPLAVALVAAHELEQLDLSPMRHGHDPFGAQISVGRATGTPVLGIVHAQDRAFLEAVLAMDQVREYAYWNHIEHPEHLAQFQWEERCETWAAVCPGAPAETMVTIASGTEASRTLELRRLARDVAGGRRTLPAPSPTAERGARLATRMAAHAFVENAAPGAQLFSTYLGALSRYRVAPDAALAAQASDLLTPDPRDLAGARLADLPVASVGDLAALRQTVREHVAQVDQP